MMANCPGSCCQWMSPIYFPVRMRRVEDMVTITPLTTWPWSRKVSKTRAYFFPTFSPPSSFPPSGFWAPPLTVSLLHVKNAEVGVGTCSYMSRTRLASRKMAQGESIAASSEYLFVIPSRHTLGSSCRSPMIPVLPSLKLAPIKLLLA